MYGKKHSKATIANMAIAKKDKCQKIEVTDLTKNQSN